MFLTAQSFSANDTVTIEDINKYNKFYIDSEKYKPPTSGHFITLRAFSIRF